MKEMLDDLTNISNGTLDVVRTDPDGQIRIFVDDIFLSDYLRTHEGDLPIGEGSLPGLGLCVMQPKTAKTSLDQDYTFSWGVYFGALPQWIVIKTVCKGNTYVQLQYHFFYIVFIDMAFVRIPEKAKCSICRNDEKSIAICNENIQKLKDLKIEHV